LSLFCSSSCEVSCFNSRSEFPRFRSHARLATLGKPATYLDLLEVVQEMLGITTPDGLSVPTPRGIVQGWLHSGADEARLYCRWTRDEHLPHKL
jgi:hypothetical protein